MVLVVVVAVAVLIRVVLLQVEGLGQPVALDWVVFPSEVESSSVVEAVAVPLPPKLFINFSLADCQLELRRYLAC